MELMQPVTVAIADINRDRRTEYECILKAEQGITLLTNVTSDIEAENDSEFENRRLESRVDISAVQDEVARIKRLNPLVVLVNLNQSTDEDYALLLSMRRECPKVLVVLLADDSIHESQIIQALELGVRGYLKYDSVQIYLPKAVQIVGRGEAWVPRKILGNIMDRVLN